MLNTSRPVVRATGTSVTDETRSCSVQSRHKLLDHITCLNKHRQRANGIWILQFQPYPAGTSRRHLVPSGRNSTNGLRRGGKESPTIMRKGFITLGYNLLSSDLKKEEERQDGNVQGESVKKQGSSLRRKDVVLPSCAYVSSGTLLLLVYGAVNVSSWDRKLRWISNKKPDFPSLS
ncbi:hypothetical protein F2P81_002399 [Scophthalmus maximus]|uniref:Uncharacterized protein n=1 Tax=Scophthalmus maximus TaxID=52904 RepID=A0A6A4TQK5_SCOMX|nr:hypothetical protein F2P81_002399 [Scophthalmus maximus]